MAAAAAKAAAAVGDVLFVAVVAAAVYRGAFSLTVDNEVFGGRDLE